MATKVIYFALDKWQLLLLASRGLGDHPVLPRRAPWLGTTAMGSRESSSFMQGEDLVTEESHVPHVENSDDKPCCPALFAVWDRGWGGGVGEGRAFIFYTLRLGRKKPAKEPPNNNHLPVLPQELPEQARPPSHLPPAPRASHPFGMYWCLSVVVPLHSPLPVPAVLSLPMEGNETCLPPPSLLLPTDDSSEPHPVRQSPGSRA